MTDDDVQAAAEILARCRLRGERFDRFPDALRPRDEDEAYAIQRQVHQLLTSSGWGEVVGYKIGCTTPVMQEFLGIPNPCSGAIFAPNVHTATGHFDFHSFCHVGVECEIAARIGEDLECEPSRMHRERVLGAVDAVVAAIEVVDDRYVDYPSLDTPTLIADDFFHAGCVLGTTQIPWDDELVADLVGTMTINGDVVGSGRSDAILGHPANAIIWFAAAAAARSRPLLRGDFVMLGSLVATVWVPAGATVAIEVTRLGRAEAHFSSEHVTESATR